MRGWLLVVGCVIGGCYVSSDTRPAAPPPPPPGQPVAQASPAKRPSSSPTGPSCGVDEVFENVCGANKSAPCGPTGDTVEGFGTLNLVITPMRNVARNPDLAHFVYDDVATQAWRTKVGDLGRRSGQTYCCYAGCTKLRVAASAPQPAVPAGHSIHDRCIPPPPGGTSVPAQADARCPAAVAFGGGSVIAPYRGPARGRTHDNVWWYQGASCCYTTVVRDPPRNMGHCPTCKCAATGTPIMTPTGERAIESLRVGDLVLGIDRGELRAVPIAEIGKTRVVDHSVVEVALDTGRTVTMSPLHPTASGTTFGDLRFGDRLGDATVITTSRIPYADPFTYDILPASDSGTYVAAGALVGSTLFR